MNTYLLSFMLLTATALGANNVNAEVMHFTQLPGDITEVVYYYPNGAVMQKGYTENNLKTGEWITYSLAGKITARAYYENGKKVGKWKVYDADGDLAYKIQYRNDKKVWAQQYDQAGNTIAFNYK